MVVDAEVSDKPCRRMTPVGRLLPVITYRHRPLSSLSSSKRPSTSRHGPMAGIPKDRHWPSNNRGTARYRRAKCDVPHMDEKGCESVSTIQCTCRWRQCEFGLQGLSPDVAIPQFPNAMTTEPYSRLLHMHQEFGCPSRKLLIQIALKVHLTTRLR